MAKAFSILVWNVEHFGAKDKKKKKPKKPVAPIVKAIADVNADVVAIIEVRSSLVAAPLMEAMPNHFFFITEGEQMQEILVGIRKTLPAFVTQKNEFQAGQTTLRPGLLVTPVVDEVPYPLLFLHVKSAPDPRGFGIRNYMVEKAFGFRNVLKKVLDGEAPNYIFLGDLNTMGMDYLGSDKDISGKREIKELAASARRRKMRLLSKSYPATYWSERYGENDLDHVVAMKHLKFKKFGGQEVRVSGWNEKGTDAGKKAWVKKYSDHAMLYLEVQKV
ncbi:MAG: endonuclease/exonuclease/phosphatase family protein [Pseudomonadota bacterium]